MLLTGQLANLSGANWRSVVWFGRAFADRPADWSLQQYLPCLTPQATLQTWPTSVDCFQMESQHRGTAAWILSDFSAGFVVWPSAHGFAPACGPRWLSQREYKETPVWQPVTPQPVCGHRLDRSSGVFVYHWLARRPGGWPYNSAPDLAIGVGSRIQSNRLHKRCESSHLETFDADSWQADKDQDSG